MSQLSIFLCERARMYRNRLRTVVTDKCIHSEPLLEVVPYNLRITVFKNFCSNYYLIIIKIFLFSNGEHWE